MSHSRWHKAAVAAAAITLVLGTSACGESGPENPPPATTEYTPAPAPEAPPPVATYTQPAPEAPAPVDPTYTQPAPEKPIAPEAGPCPLEWPQQDEYGGPNTKYYKLTADYTQYFRGFNICTSTWTSGSVLYNNTGQVWSFLSGTAVRYAVDPAPYSVAALFHTAFPQQVFVVPGEIVEFTGDWPPEIAWAPDPGLTSAWLGQALALEHLEFNAKSGNLTQDVSEFIRNKQLQATNPAGAALLGCAKSGYEAASGAAALNSTSELLDRLKVGLDGTKGATSCATSIRKTFIDEAKGSTDWAARVNRASTVAGDGVDAIQVLRPILEYCPVIRFLTGLGTLRNVCR